MGEPQSIGSYDLLKLLATGGMAEIYLAKSKTLKGKFVAVKRTIPDLIDSPEMSTMFADEMKVAACLNHQNVVQTFDFGVVDARAYLVMEYIHGVSLRELLSALRGKTEFLNIPIILHIIKKVAEGLAYVSKVHDPVTGAPLNLIHRDLSPHNIMLTYEGEVKIIDFGIAKAISTTQTQHGIIKGKLAYMSPEQMRGEEIDQRSDLFSLGVIFWEMLSNTRFFAGTNAQDLKQTVSNYQVENIDCSTWGPLEPILRKLLHHDVKQRYLFASDVARDLQKLLNQLYPQFSSEEIVNLLKVKYFRKEYEVSLEEMRQLQGRGTAIISDPPKLPKALILEAAASPSNQVSSVSDNPGRNLKEVLTYFFSGVIVCCLFYIGYLNVDFDLPELDTVQFSSSSVPISIPATAPTPLEEYPISFVTVPRNATIKVNGKTLSTLGVAYMMMKTKSQYNIQISKAGYVSRSFKFSPTKPARYEIHLSSQNK